jgi:hypothetical protein
MLSYFQYIHSLNVKILNSRPASIGQSDTRRMYMKRNGFFKLLGLFALITAIGFSMTACPHEAPNPYNTVTGNTTDQGNTDPDNTDQGNTDPGNADQGNIDQGNTDPVVPGVNLFEATWKGFNNSTTVEYTLTFVSDGTWTISPALGGGNGDTGTYTYDDKVATLLSANSAKIGTLTIGVDGKLSGNLKGVSGSSIDNAGKLGGGILGGLGKL